MKLITMFRMLLATLAVLALVNCRAPAQFITAGSTLEGDYLRGVGIAGWGMGLYNLNTAQAESIHTDTYMHGPNISRPSPRNRPACTWHAKSARRRK